MELLPVIYWSLFSVGILALVVLLFSFITFQFRKKYGNIPSDEVSEKEREKKVKVTNPDKKAVKDKKSNPEKKHHPKVQTVSKNKSTSHKPQKDHKAGSKDAKLYKKPTRDSKQNRLEVLNENLEKNQSKDKSSKSETKYHSLKVDSKQNDWN